MAFLVSFSLGVSDVGGVAVVMLLLILVTLIVEVNVQRRTPNSEGLACCRSSLVTRYFRLNLYHEEGPNASRRAGKLAWFF